MRGGLASGGIVPKKHDDDKVLMMVSPSTTYLSKALVDKLEDKKSQPVVVVVHYQPLKKTDLKAISELLNGKQN